LKCLARRIAVQEGGDREGRAQRHPVAESHKEMRTSTSGTDGTMNGLGKE